MGLGCLWDRPLYGAGLPMGPGCLWGWAPYGAGLPVGHHSLWGITPYGALLSMGQSSVWDRAVYGTGLPMGPGSQWGQSPYGAELCMGQGCLWVWAPYGSGLPMGPIRRCSPQALLDLGGSPNYKDRRGLTPLYHTAMVGGDPRCCELLLAHRARIGTEDENGWQEIHQVGPTATHSAP